LPVEIREFEEPVTVRLLATAKKNPQPAGLPLRVHASSRNGVAVLAGVSTCPLPRKDARDVPMAKPYRHAMTEDKLLRVNPSDNEIAEVATGPQRGRFRGETLRGSGSGPGSATRRAETDRTGSDRRTDAGTSVRRGG